MGKFSTSIDFGFWTKLEYKKKCIGVGVAMYKDQDTLIMFRYILDDTSTLIHTLFSTFILTNSASQTLRLLVSRTDVMI